MAQDARRKDRRDSRQRAHAGKHYELAEHPVTAADVWSVPRCPGLANFDGRAEAARQVSRAHLGRCDVLFQPRPARR
jgi:hypothetical protein